MNHMAKFRTVYCLATWTLLAGVSIASPASAQSSQNRPNSPLPQPLLLESSDNATSDYILGIGDQLEITVFDYAEFTGSREVLPDGSIIMPMIGQVDAVNKTTEELERDLTERLQTLLVNPVVTVNLQSLRPVIVNVAGEVQRPGSIQLRGVAATGSGTAESTASEQNLTLANALIAAGGITSNADIRRIVVTRYSPDGDATPEPVDLWDAIQSERAAPLPILRDGDSIYVPKLPDNAEIDRRLITRSQFAPATVRVRVVGEVTQPGEVLVPPDSSISSAVAIAGGPTEDADLSEVSFIRLDPSGKPDPQQLDLRNLSDTNQIQDGDVVIVPKRNSSSVLDFANRLLPPLSLILNLLLP
jgi:polysaccharide biosynthesis/export protein